MLHLSLGDYRRPLGEWSPSVLLGCYSREVKSLYTGQSVGTATANLQIAVFFFRSKLILPEGEGPASQIETWQGDGQRRAFTPAVILFIALPEAKDNIDPG